MHANCKSRLLGWLAKVGVVASRWQVVQVACAVEEEEVGVVGIVSGVYSPSCLQRDSTSCWLLVVRGCESERGRQIECGWSSRGKKSGRLREQGAFR